MRSGFELRKTYYAADSRHPENLPFEKRMVYRISSCLYLMIGTSLPMEAAGIRKRLEAQRGETENWGEKAASQKVLYGGSETIV